MLFIWLFRATLFAVLVAVVVAYVRASYAEPFTDHRHFDLETRQRIVASRLRDMGARLCCPPDGCSQVPAMLGAHARHVRTTTQKRTPQCGAGEVLLLANKQLMPVAAGLHVLEILTEKE